jgi:hypothetical protein
VRATFEPYSAFYTYASRSLSCASGMIIHFLNKAIDIRHCNVTVVAGPGYRDNRFDVGRRD